MKTVPPRGILVMGAFWAVLVVLFPALAHGQDQNDDAAMANCPTSPSNGAAPICVTTYHNQNTRKGLNTNEQTLTKTNIQQKGLTSFTYAVTGQVYAQPLFLPQIVMAADHNPHNVAFVATETNDVYAFDGDSQSNNGGNPYWHANLTTPPGQPNRQIVTMTQLNGCTNIEPDIGITGTPVINITSSSTSQISGANLYLVARAWDGGVNFYQTLYVLDATSGNIKAWTDITNVSSGGATFDPHWENQRGALLFQAGQVFITWGSHCDQGNLHPKTANWHGWLISYKLQVGSLNLTGVWVASGLPEAGIWQSGSGPAGDNTFVYLGTGNGSTSAAPVSSENPCVNCYGNTIVKLSGPTALAFSVADSFTPHDHPVRFCNDYDTGSGGLLLLPNTSFNPPNLLVQSGKEGNIYMLNTASGSMGGYGGPMGSFSCPQSTSSGTDNIVQALYNDLCTTDASGPECGIQGSPVFWNNSIFFGPRCQPIKQYQLQNTGTVSMLFKNATMAGGTATSGCNYTPGMPVFPYPGASLAVSQFTGGAILWALDNSHFFGGRQQAPPVLYAYDASNLAASLLFSGNAGSATTSSYAIKFAVPTVANGHVYVGNANELVVFSLKP